MAEIHRLTPPDDLPYCGDAGFPAFGYRPPKPVVVPLCERCKHRTPARRASQALAVNGTIAVDEPHRDNPTLIGPEYRTVDRCCR